MARLWNRTKAGSYTAVYSPAVTKTDNRKNLQLMIAVRLIASARLFARAGEVRDTGDKRAGVLPLYTTWALPLTLFRCG